MAALRIFSDKRETHGVALELAMIHYFVVSRKFSPLQLYTDLQGKEIKRAPNLSFDCGNIEFIRKEDRGSLEELVDGTVYVLWEGAAVIDFFVYHSSSKYAWIQISKSKYNAHSTKADDIFEPAANYPLDFQSGSGDQRHSPYTFFVP